MHHPRRVFPNAMAPAMIHQTRLRNKCRSYVCCGVIKRINEIGVHGRHRGRWSADGVAVSVYRRDTSSVWRKTSSRRYLASPKSALSSCVNEDAPMEPERTKQHPLFAAQGPVKRCPLHQADDHGSPPVASFIGEICLKTELNRLPNLDGSLQATPSSWADRAIKLAVKLRETRYYYRQNCWHTTHQRQVRDTFCASIH